MAEISTKGMHTVPHNKDLAMRRRVKNARNDAHATEGLELSNGFRHHKSCRSYGCKHRKHGAPK